MKKIYSLILISILFSGCRKHYPDIPDDDDHSSNVVIKGTITDTNPDPDSLSLGNAQFVLIFNGTTKINSRYQRVVYIQDGVFSSPVKMGTGIALAFLDKDLYYIGSLCTDSLSILPLGNLSNGDQTIINLSTLSLSGRDVIPAHNPLGTEIVINKEELSSFLALDGYYESLTKNIDVDNDGLPDLLSNKQIIVTSVFRIYIGHWGCNDTLAASFDPSTSVIDFIMSIEGGSDLTFDNNDILLTGPADSAYNDIELVQCTKNPYFNTGFIAHFARKTSSSHGSPWDYALLPFKKGTYTLTFNWVKQLTFDYSNKEAVNGLICAIPTIQTDNENNIMKVTLDYKLPSGIIVRPENMLTDVTVRFIDSNGIVFHSRTLTNESGFYDFTLNSIYELSNLYQINISYGDLLGNRYEITWL